MANNFGWLHPQNWFSSRQWLVAQPGGLTLGVAGALHLVIIRPHRMHAVYWCGLCTVFTRMQVHNYSRQVIWHKIVAPPCTGCSVVFARWRQCALHLNLIHGFLDPREYRYVPEQHLDQFIRFAKHTRCIGAETDHATSLAIGRIYILRACDTA